MLPFEAPLSWCAIHNGGEGWFVRVDVSRGRFPCDGPGRGGTCQERSYHPVALHSSQLLTFLPSPHGLLPLLTGNWALIAHILAAARVHCLLYGVSIRLWPEMHSSLTPWAYSLTDLSSRLCVLSSPYVAGARCILHVISSAVLGFG